MNVILNALHAHNAHAYNYLLITDRKCDTEVVFLLHESVKVEAFRWLDPNPVALGREAEYTVERSPICHRANKTIWLILCHTCRQKSSDPFRGPVESGSRMILKVLLVKSVSWAQSHRYLIGLVIGEFGGQINGWGSLSCFFSCC